MEEPSFSDFYARVIKEGSRSNEEELRRCKNVLEFLWNIALDLENPPYLDELLDELKENVVFNETATKGPMRYALDNLIELLLKMRQVTPMYDYVRNYFENKNCLGSFKRYEDALDALELATCLSIPTEPLRDFVTPGITIPRPQSGGYQKSFLRFHMRYGTKLIEGALLLALAGRMTSFCILLRSALEIILKGMLYEHLRSPKFRVKVERANWRRHDSVTTFVYQAEQKMKKLNAGWEVILYSFEGTAQADHLGQYRVRNLKINGQGYMCPETAIWDRFARALNFDKEKDTLVFVMNKDGTLEIKSEK